MTDTPLPTDTPTITPTPTVTPTATVTFTPTPTPCAPEDETCWILGSAARYAILGFQYVAGTPTPLALRTPVPFNAKFSNSVTGEICVGSAVLGHGTVVNNGLTGTAGTGLSAVSVSNWVTVTGGVWTGGGTLKGVSCVDHEAVVDPSLHDVTITGGCDDSGANDHAIFCDLAAMRATAAYDLLSSLPPTAPGLDLGEVRVRAHKTLTLPPPGVFPGDVFPDGRTVVRMTSLQLGSHSDLVLNANSGLSEVVLLVQRAPRFGNSSILQPVGFDASRIIILVTDTSPEQVHIGMWAQLNGTLVAFGHPISMRSRAQINGALIGGVSISPRYNATINRVPFTGQ